MTDKDNDLLENDEDQVEFEIDIEEDDSPAGNEGTDDKDFEDSEKEESKTPDKTKAKQSLEEEDARKQATDDGYDYDDLTDEEKAKYGRRAQKRIKTLVGKAKTLEEKLKEQEERAKKLEEELSRHRGFSQQATVYAVEQQEKRIEAQRLDVARRLSDAREAGDTEAEIKALDALSTLAAEERELSRVKKQFGKPKKAEAEDGDDVEFDSPKTNTQRRTVESDTASDGQSAVEPDPRALDWYEKNTWFNDGGNPTHKVMTARAIQIHQSLINEGYDPVNDADEYYEELDSRIRSRFKDYFKNSAQSREKPKQTMTGGARMAGTKGKNTVRLTQQQVAMAKRLGITPQQYAKELLKLERGERAS